MFDLGIDPALLEGETLSARARELVLLMTRTGRLDDLVMYCRKMRPHARLP